jgi:lipopolysaccharide/colanic/teichoic acid biosynthesis glycosyltransferase
VTELAERKGDTVTAPRRDGIKRAFDIVFSLAAIIVTAPLLLFLCLLVRLTSAGPALFRQERLGQDKQQFTLLKLRSMYTGNDDRVHRDYVTSLLRVGQGSHGDAAGQGSNGDSADRAGHGDSAGQASQGDTGMFKLEADPRITTLGAWLRRTSLDEMPQLVNVLRGEMSLVGPRPVLPWEAELFGDAYAQRFAVKPGLTGLWQVSGRSRLPMSRALELDVEYAIRRSFVLDLIILVRTVPALFGGGAR